MRPLRIDLQFDAEKLESFKASKEFGKLSDSDQNAVSAYIEQHFGDSKDYAWFENTFLNNLPLSKVSKGLKNALIAAFGVQNPDAEAVEINGEVQMDSELTDYGNIPLNQDIADIYGKEVLPHAPDAIIDTTYTDSTKTVKSVWWGMKLTLTVISMCLSSHATQMTLWRKLKSCLPKSHNCLGRFKDAI